MRRHVINGVLIVVIAMVFAAFDHAREGAAAPPNLSQVAGAGWLDCDGGISAAWTATDPAMWAATVHVPDAGAFIQDRGGALLVECSAEPDPLGKLGVALRAQDVHVGTHLHCYRSDGVSW